MKEKGKGGIKKEFSRKRELMVRFGYRTGFRNPKSKIQN